MSQNLRPWRPEDFEDAHEDCGAQPGEFCRPHCPTGYTLAMHHKAMKEREERTRA